MTKFLKSLKAFESPKSFENNFEKAKYLISEQYVGMGGLDLKSILVFTLTSIFILYDIPHFDLHLNGLV